MTDSLVQLCLHNQFKIQNQIHRNQQLNKMQKVDHIFHHTEDFTLEAGGILHGFQLKYTTLGSLNANRDNVIWICHALTGSSDFTDWWKDLFSDGTPFDPREYFIICANV